MRHLLALLILSGCGEETLASEPPSTSAPASPAPMPPSMPIAADAGQPTRPAVIIHSVSPSFGAAGTRVSLSVAGLDDQVPEVAFGSAAAAAVRVEAGLVTCDAPASVEGLVDVTVTVPHAVSTLSRAFRFVATSAPMGDAGTPADAGQPADAGTAPDAGALDAGTLRTTRLEAEAHATAAGINVIHDGVAIGYFDQGDWFAFDGVDLRGLERVTLQLASPTAGGRIELHADQPDGPLLATLMVSATGDWTTFASQSVSATASTSTRVVVVGAAGAPNLANVDWLELSSR